MILTGTINGLIIKNLGLSCGYSDFSGYNGGGVIHEVDHRGSAGWTFIYCNTAINQDTTGTVLAN